MINWRCVTCRFPAKATILGHPSPTETATPASGAALPARVAEAVGSAFTAATGFDSAAVAAGSVSTIAAGSGFTAAAGSVFTAAAAAIEGVAYAATTLTLATVAAARSACALKRS